MMGILDPKIKARWLRALKSGLYKKGRRQLVTPGNGADKFCCLGVLADLQGATFVDGTVPVGQTKGYLLTDKKLASAAEQQAMTDRAHKRVKAAFEFARESDYPAARDALNDVFVG